MLQTQEKRIWDTPLYADFPRTEYDDRLARVRKLMEEQKLDLLVLWDPARGLMVASESSADMDGTVEVPAAGMPPMPMAVSGSGTVRLQGG